ncbi:MetQ/NlpA family ABC transporter substrate-binding protein [Paenibacillus wynnii]|uniref:MetQ/NlpA family ABC transporter substrate-binding protein n=1 Tax=Paenibacillus wynnii TaxID=268407 RepID=UPI0027920653|nr:MetQ/NlpA family ABC transporter substrate-binding protein [Paenibacillus wynnii]MDQ0193721.1 D-methionine transport system substrate-binding protein [Paenibacillus wynnii]
MKKLIIMVLTLTVIIAGCGEKKASEGSQAPDSAESSKLKVATLIPPMTDIMDIVKPLLKEDGIELEIVILSDNVQPNEALANKEVDANFFQHVPYMEQFNASKGSELVAVQPVYNAIYGGYSKRFKNIGELPDGSTLVMANDPSNIGRSLVMFEAAGLIKLKEGVGIQATQADIVENPRKFVFEEVDLLMLARMLDDADLVAMTPAYASPLGLTPKKDALITENEDSEFSINLVSRKDNKDSAAIKKLAERMSGPEVRKFLEDNYADIAIPAFK